MEGLMIRLLNMSFAAGCTVLIVLVLRICIKRLPKSYSYGLWLIVLFRFLCPVVIPSAFSLLPVNPEPMSREIVYEAEPKIQTGVIWVDRAVNGLAGESLAVKSLANSVNPIQIWLAVGFYLWMVGALLFAVYHLYQLAVLKRTVAEAVPLPEEENEENKKISIRESDRISGAFTLGVLRPVIYLPVGLKGETKGFILQHEKVHIKRRDYLVKLLGLAAVAVHWFNPLAWVGFRLMCADMEMSCDEQVVRLMEGDRRKAYSQTLLDQAEKQNVRMLPLAFGKSHTYLRIRNILAYHKPGALLTAVALVILAAVGIGLITSPEKREEIMDEKDNMSVSIIGGADGPTSVFVAGKMGGEEELIWQRERPDSEWLAFTEITDSEEGKPGEEAGDRTETGRAKEGPSELHLDFASDRAVIFHGDFGLFSFEKSEEGTWRQQIFIKDVDTGEKLAEALEKVVPGQIRNSKTAIGLEDGFRITDISGNVRGRDSSWENFAIIDYDGVKMADGRVGVLGTASSAGDGPARLIDLYYGYYDPGEQRMKQVFLFLGDGQEIENPEGQVSEGHWLFERDGYDYYLRTPQKLLETEEDRTERFRYHIAYGRTELVRSRDNREELMDDLVFLDRSNPTGMVLTEERVVYRAFADSTILSFKRPLIASIRLDGSDRRIWEAPYGVTRNLCYGDGYLYYEGWTNDSAFPVPLMRLRPDFTEEEKIGELPGSLICVREGGACLWMDWEQKRIMAGSVENSGLSGPKWEYLENGETGRRETCTMENEGNGYLRIVLESVENPSRREEYRLMIPPSMWEE